MTDQTKNCYRFVFRHNPVQFVQKYGKPYHKLRMFRCLSKEKDATAPYKAELKNIQNPDGGWPWHWEQDYPSGMAETARAVEVLLLSGEDKNADFIKRALEMISALQRPDGGWAENKKLKEIIPKEWDWISIDYSSTWITAAIVRAFIHAGYDKDKRVRKGLAFLHSKQKEDGGWPTHVGPDYRYGPDLASMDDILKTLLLAGESRTSKSVKRLENCLLAQKDQWKIPAFTVSVLALLYLLNYSIESRPVQEVINMLINQQNEDGGWSWQENVQSDPWHTCLCIEQLVLFDFNFE